MYNPSRELQTPIPNIDQDGDGIAIENFDPFAMLESGAATRTDNELEAENPFEEMELHGADMIEGNEPRGNANNDHHDDEIFDGANFVLVNDTLNRQTVAAQENYQCPGDPLQIPVDPNAANEADALNGASTDTENVTSAEVKIEPIPSIEIVNAEALAELMRQAHRAGPSTSGSAEERINNQDNDSDSADVICLTEAEFVAAVKPIMEPNYGLVKQKDDIFSGDAPFRQLVNRF